MPNRGPVRNERPVAGLASSFPGYEAVFIALPPAGETTQAPPRRGL